jgi:hypothetical protein
VRWQYGAMNRQKRRAEGFACYLKWKIETVWDKVWVCGEKKENRLGGEEEEAMYGREGERVWVCENKIENRLRKEEEGVVVLC